MTDIPDEAVEAAFDRVGMRIKVLPAGSPYTARDLLYSALEAALPYLGNYTADLCEEIEHKDARIKELEGLLCRARDLALDATDSGDLPDFYGWLDAVNALINEGSE